MSFPAVAPCQRTAVTQADHCRPGAPNTLRSQSYTWRRLVSMDIIGEKAVAEPTMATATARASILQYFVVQRQSCHKFSLVFPRDSRNGA